jgi:hypothetical protein
LAEIRTTLGDALRRLTHRADRLCSVLCLLLAAALMLTSCSSPATEAVEPEDALVQRAKADLAKQLGIRQNEITVESVEQREFPDTSLGVPEPGRAYAQVVTPGYVIKLIAGNTVYEYHAKDDRVVLASGEGNTGDELLVIEGVQVDLTQIMFSGSTLLPEGTCLLSQLYIDESPASWWPADVCIRVQEGSWEIRVPLGENGAPDELDALIQHKLRVCSQGDPSVVTEFWFDLSGPPSP